ncbi:antitoxin VapB family protein [Candidatus Woesearchaeota archaeon]|nr:antitoxin VapB family protein [Candidatus Woesearchaeota archaeon]
MAVKTITITEEAYNRLRAAKSEGESFTDAIMKVTNKNPLDALTGILPKEAAEEIKANIARTREETRKKMKRLMERFS